MMTVYWRQGEAHGLVWSQGLALVAGEVDVDAATTLWLTCRQGITVGQFLEELARVSDTSLLSLPDFVVALDKGAAVHMAARGAMLIDVSTESGDEQVSGAQVSTWAERQMGGVTGICVRLLTAPDDGAPARPLEAGLVPAGELRRGIQVLPAAKVSAAVEPAMPAVAEVDSDEPPVEGLRPIDLMAPDPESPDAGLPEPVAHESELSETASSRPPVAQRGLEDDPVSVQPQAQLAHETATWVAPEPVIDESLPAPAEPSRDIADPDSSAAASQPVVLSEYEMLWGDTSAVDIEQAAALLPDPDAPVASPSPSAQPEAATAPADTSAPLLSLDQIDDHDSMTIISLEDPPHSEQPLPAGNQPVNAGSVVAILCPLGHANPPHRSGCRSCSAPLLGEPLRVPRPALGWMRTAEGEHIDLTSPVIIGRKPTVTRLQGLEMPLLVAVPHGHVSSNHLEIRLEGWNVMAVDLHSRNGTLMRRPGEPPVRLPERPTMLVAGDVLDLGHGVQFSFHELP